MKLSLSLFVSTLALMATTTVAKGYRSRYHLCPKDATLNGSCGGKVEGISCIADDQTTYLKCTKGIFVVTSGVGEAFTDLPAAAPKPLCADAKDCSGDVVMLTLPPSKERVLSEAYTRTNMEVDSAAASGFIEYSFIGFAATVGVVALL
jgi:hypothetical protein